MEILLPWPSWKKGVHTRITRPGIQPFRIQLVLDIRHYLVPPRPQEAAINTTTPNPLSLAPWTVLEVGGVVMDAKVPICRLLRGSLRPGPAYRLVFYSPRPPRRGALGLLASAWSSSRPGGTWPRAETLRVAEQGPPPRRPTRFRPGSAPACLHCSPALRSCAWRPEQLGGGPRTSQRGVRPDRSGTVLRGPRERECVPLAS